MTKRFCDGDIWDKDWFLELSLKQKLLAKFLFDKCDCAGIYKIGYTTLKNCIGEEISKDDFKKIKQVIFLNEDTIFIEDFVLFQCSIASLNELNAKNNAHKGIIKRLQKYNLLGAPEPLVSPKLAPSEPLASPLAGAQEKEKEKEKDYITEKRNKKVFNSSKGLYNPDLFFDKNVEKVFSLYKEHCKNLVPIVYERNNPDRRQEIKEFLGVVRYDFVYITELFRRADRQIVYYDNKINLKSLIKNHEGIYQGLGAAIAKANPQGSTERFNQVLEELTEKYRAKELDSG